MFIEKKSCKINFYYLISHWFISNHIKVHNTRKKTEKSDRPIFSFGTVQLASKFMVIINASNKACGFH